MKFKDKLGSRLLAMLIAASMLIPQAAFADSGAQEDTISKLLGKPTTAEEKAELITTQYGATSVQYALIDNGSIAVSGNSGVYSLKENKALAEDTMYGIGSISKMYTTAVIMKLADKGRIDLDKPVVTYLPQFRMADNRYRKITVRMLLNHSSGLMGSSIGNAFLMGDQDTQAHDQLLERLSKQNLKADPGAFSVYCNDGFTLAELVAEKVTGKSFTELVESEISKPLGLTATKTPLSQFNREQLAKVYIPGNSEELPPEEVGIIGTGGIYSTAQELCRFAEIFMDRADKTPAGAVLSRASAEQMAQPEFARGIWPDKDRSNADGFGLGWDSVSASAFRDYGIQELVKGGDTLFYHGSLVVLPEQNMAAAVVSSGGSSIYCQLLAEKLLMDRLTQKGLVPEGEEPQDDQEPQESQENQEPQESQENQTAQEPQEAVEEQTAVGAGSETMPSQLTQYTGYYANRTGVLKVGVNSNGKMIITSPGNDEYQEVYYYVPGSAETDRGPYFTDELELVAMAPVTESNGLAYLQLQGPSVLPGLGVVETNAYCAQKLPEAAISPEILKAWGERAEVKYFSLNEKYTSGMYFAAAPIAYLGVNGDYPGYALGGIPTSPNDTKVFLQLPGGGRDLAEFHAYREGGVEYISDNDTAMIAESGLPELKESLEVKIGKEGLAVWMKTGESAGRMATVWAPEKGAYFVYDEDSSLKSTSRVTENNTFQLPEQGALCLAGEPGENFRVELEPFSDALPGDWYYQGVRYIADKKLTAGTGAYEFSPEENVDRAMAVMMLYQMSNQQEEKFGLKATTAAVFADVSAEDWYCDAVSWAKATGIAAGMGENQENQELFSPQEAISREQLVQMLYQYAQKLGWKTPAEGMAIKEFSDGHQVSPWAQDAMGWAIGQGLISGKTALEGDGDQLRIDPQGTASRAETAVILMKFMESADK